MRPNKVETAVQWFHMLHTSICQIFWSWKLNLRYNYSSWEKMGIYLVHLFIFLFLVLCLKSFSEEIFVLDFFFLRGDTLLSNTNNFETDLFVHRDPNMYYHSGQCVSRSNGNEGVINIPQISRTGASLSDAAYCSTQATLIYESKIDFHCSLNYFHVLFVDLKEQCTKMVSYNQPSLLSLFFSFFYLVPFFRSK